MANEAVFGNKKSIIDPHSGEVITVTDDMLSSIDTIESWRTVNIPENRQMTVQDTLVTDGTLVVDGTLIVDGTDFQGQQQIDNPSATKTTNYTITVNDKIILVDATSGDITITFPAAATIQGMIFYIKRLDNSGYTVTLAADGSETIDGTSTKTITNQYTNVPVLATATELNIL